MNVHLHNLLSDLHNIKYYSWEENIYRPKTVYLMITKVMYWQICLNYIIQLEYRAATIQMQGTS